VARIGAEVFRSVSPLLFELVVAVHERNVASLGFSLRVRGWQCGGCKFICLYLGVSVVCEFAPAFKMDYRGPLQGMHRFQFSEGVRWYPFIIDRAVHQFNPVSHQGLGSSGLVSIP
ncbi:unnamed protein product, partial [Brassica napus]